MRPVWMVCADTSLLVPATRKRLDDFVCDRTFLARRHAGLLVTDRLVWDPLLRELQECYRVEVGVYERRRVALRFQRLVRGPQALMLERILSELVPGRRVGRPRKSLAELVCSGGFHRVRHRQLL